MAAARTAGNSHTTTAATSGSNDDTAYFLEEVSIDDDDTSLKYEEVPADVSDDEDENFGALLKTMKGRAGATDTSTAATAAPTSSLPSASLSGSMFPPIAAATESKRPPSKKPSFTEGSSTAAAAGEATARAERLEEQVRQLKAELQRVSSIAEQAKLSWEKFRKERDYHRMNHRRVVQEKNSLIRDMKRIKSHYAQFEPALNAMRKKYEEASREKAIIKMERDKMKLKMDAMEAQIRQSETTNSGEAKEEKKEEKERKAASRSLRRGVADSVLPPDDRVNPYLTQTLEPVRADRFALRKTFKGHTRGIAGVAVHPKKPIIATVSDDMTWKLWSVPKGELIMSGDGHKDWVAKCDFHPGGSLLATASGDGTVKIWDFVRARCATTFSDHAKAVWSVEWHDMGDFVVSASLDNTAKLWDINSERCRQTLRGHRDSVNCVTFQPFTNNVCTTSGDKTVSLWDTRSGLCVQTFYGHDNAVLHASFNCKGDTFASSDADGVVKIWDLRTVAELRHITTADVRVAVNDVRFDRSGSILACASDRGIIKIYSAADGKFLADLAGHEDGVHSLAFDPRGEFLVSASSDATFRLWAA